MILLVRLYAISLDLTYQKFYNVQDQIKCVFEFLLHVLIHRVILVISES